LPSGSYESFTSLPEALNYFYKERIYRSKLMEEKASALRMIHRDLVRARNYIQSSRIRLEKMGAENNFRQMGDLIMANLHAIPAGADKIELPDFYTGKPITIQIKRGISPQKIAENYYRKAKNQKIEIEKISENIQQKARFADQLELKKINIEDVKDLRELRNLLKEKKTVRKSADKISESRFRHFNYAGYDIFIGKSSKSNEELTFGSGSKDDLWLHAKDVPGSHVIMVNKPGKKIPEPAIKRAAELAAYFSKNRNNTYCPVTFTSRKFVRKLKGGSTGQVIVEREQVIFVEPRME
jgi:predicted ribosome quality control (RQC) complex YloA/Tae2 family protein